MYMLVAVGVHNRVAAILANKRRLFTMSLASQTIFTVEAGWVGGTVA